MFEILFAMYVIQYINMLGDELNNPIIMFVIIVFVLYLFKK